MSVSCGVSVPGSGICTGGRPIQANGTTGCRRSTRPGPEPTPRPARGEMRPFLCLCKIHLGLKKRTVKLGQWAEESDRAVRA